MKRLVLLIIAAFVLGSLVERSLGKAESPCHMVWDGTNEPLDAEDCAYMGGGGWGD